MSNNTAHQHNACNGTYYYCIPEGCSGGDHCLTHRIPCLRRSCHNWSRAQSRLIGEETSGNTIPGRHHYCSANHTSHSRLSTKGRFDYQGDCISNILPVEDQNNYTSCHIEERHKRHKRTTHLANSLYSKDNYHCHQGCKHKTCNISRNRGANQRGGF